MEPEQLCMGCMAEKGNAAQCPHCGWVEGTLPGSPLHLPPRTVLQEKYLLGRVLGQGGFGITYLGWDLNLNLKLAIKEYMPQDLASRAAGQSRVAAYTGTMSGQFDYGLDKFLQEARTLAQFEGHPNIVSVRDFFKANGTAYIVMSYLDGMDLKDFVAAQGNRLPYEKALSLIMPALDALNEVHAANILHRDISPDNIFIKRNGQVLLIDFGAARQAISAKGHSMSIILKPGFAPEEQYRSKGVQGPWTDIYAVAATLYRITTGQMPPESLDRLAQETLVPPSQLGVSMDANAEQALLKAMAIRAGDRFQTVREFQDALLGKAAVSSRAAAPAAAGATWQIDRDGARFGPYSWERMVQLAAAGNIGPRDQVWNEGMASWQNAAAIQGLLPQAAYPAGQGATQPVSYTPQGPVSQQPVSYTPSPQGPVSQQPVSYTPAQGAMVQQPVSHTPPRGAVSQLPHSYTPPQQPYPSAGAVRKKSPLPLILGITLVLAIIIVPIVLLVKHLAKPEGPAGGQYFEKGAAGWQYEVDSFQFYESWMMDDYPDEDDRDYAATFSARDSYYIYFALSLSHAELEEDLSLPARMSYYISPGMELSSHDFTALFEAGSDESEIRGYYGWDQPGEWSPGIYWVEVLLDGKVAGTGYFTME